MTGAGAPPASHKSVWRLAGPIILSNVSIPLLGAVDTAVMGHLPDPAYLGGVAIGQVLFSYIYWGFGFLRMGTTGFVAQAYGRGDGDGLRNTLGRGLILAVVLSASVLALQVPVARLAFWLFEAGTQVEELAGKYYFIRVWSAPAVLAYYVTMGWLFGRQRPGAALLITLWLNGLNIVLDLWFVIGLGWGIEGVAWATLISEWSACLLGLFVIQRIVRGDAGHLGGRWSLDRVLDRVKMAAMLRVNRDLFIRTLLLLTGFAWLTAKGAAQGEVILAANAIILTFQSFTAYALDGFAHAAEALVGGAVGKNDRKDFRAAVRTTTIWALVFAGIFTLAWLVAGGAIVRLLTDLPDVRGMAMTLLPWAIAAPVVSVWSFQMDGIFIGATRGPEMRNAMLASLALFVVATWALMPLWGNHGLWAAFMIFMAARGVTLAMFYPRLARSVGEGGA